MTPPEIDPGAVHEFLESRNGVEAVHDLHIWGISTTQTALTAHLVMPQRANDDFLSRVSQELNERFGIGHVTLQIETAQTPCATCPPEII